MFQLTTGSRRRSDCWGYSEQLLHSCRPCRIRSSATIATGVCDFSIPAIYNENQYVVNGDYVVNSKNTISTKYFYTHNPYTSFLGQGGGNLPGTPEQIVFGNHAAVAKLTTLVTNNFVNEARVSYQQNVNAAKVTVPPGGCANEDTFTDGFTGCGSPDQLGMISECSRVLRAAILPQRGNWVQHVWRTAARQGPD